MPCPICSNDDASEIAHDYDFDYKFNCQRCGIYSITREALDDWKYHFDNLSARGKANVSGWIREHQDTNITSNEIDFLTNIKTPSVQQRADKMLLEFEKRTQKIGDTMPIPGHPPEMYEILGFTWSIDLTEVHYLANNYLTNEKNYLYEITRPPKGFAISPKGFAYLEELRQIQFDSTIGFCAMWFNDIITPAWSDAIEPAIELSGYKPERIDRVEHNNRIDDEIIARLRRSRFVVADFTGQRGGVYFESGFALGLNIPVIWTVREDYLKGGDKIEGVHFDTRQYNFITWNMDNLTDFQTKLQNRIEATIGRGPLIDANH